jgi:hypothetical protein
MFSRLSLAAVALILSLGGASAQTYIAGGGTASRDGVGGFGQLGTVFPLSSGWGVHAFAGFEALAANKQKLNIAPITGADRFGSFSYTASGRTTPSSFAGYAGLGPSYRFNNGVVLAVNAVARYAPASSRATEVDTFTFGRTTFTDTYYLRGKLAPWQYGASVSALVPFSALGWNVRNASILVEVGALSGERHKLYWDANQFAQLKKKRETNAFGRLGFAYAF